MQVLEHSSIKLIQTKQYYRGRYNTSDAVISVGHKIITALFTGYQGPVAVQLWDGRLFNNSEDTLCVLHIHHPGVLRDLILHRDLVKLGELFVAGYIDVTGMLEALFGLESHLKDLKSDYRVCLKLIFDALRLPSLNKTYYEQYIKAGHCRL